MWLFSHLLDVSHLFLLLHSQNLHHPDEDVDEVQLKTDRLIDSISLHQTPFCKSRPMQDTLHIIECESTEDGQTTPQPDILCPHECACRGGWENEWGESRDRYEGYTGEEGCSEVEVFLLLSRCADEGDGAHHADSV
jgi:hypothetical protein